MGLERFFFYKPAGRQEFLKNNTKEDSKINNSFLSSGDFAIFAYPS